MVLAWFLGVSCSFVLSLRFGFEDFMRTVCLMDIVYIVNIFWIEYLFMAIFFEVCGF